MPPPAPALLNTLYAGPSLLPCLGACVVGEEIGYNYLIPAHFTHLYTCTKTRIRERKKKLIPETKKEIKTDASIEKKRKTTSSNLNRRITCHLQPTKTVAINAVDGVDSTARDVVDDGDAFSNGSWGDGDLMHRFFLMRR